LQAEPRRRGSVQPEGDKSDPFNVHGYNVGMTLLHVLEQCGDGLTRESVMRQAATIADLELPMLLPGVRIIPALATTTRSRA
jgi:branched-chain amino acid transport system substrate-binding protein